MRLALFLSLLSFSIFYALKRGGEPERTVAIVYIIMTISDPLLHVTFPRESDPIYIGHVSIDFIGWVALFAISLRAVRFWPLCVTSLQTISLVAHVSKFLDYSIHPIAYGITQVASSYPLLIILIIGTYNHQKRLRQNGKDPSWNA